MKNPDYLTDEELQKLIASVESSDLLSAPGYLKDAIIQKAAPKRPRRQHELLLFSAKIITAAAASIALLFTMPDFEQMGNFPQRSIITAERPAENTGDDSFLRKFNQKANEFCSMISDGTNYFFQKEEHLNDQ